MDEWRKPAKPARDEFEEIRLIGTGNFCEVAHVVRHTPVKEKKAEERRKLEGISFSSDGVTDFALKRIPKDKVKKLRKEAEVLMEKECLLKLNDRAYENSHPGWHNIIKLHFTTSDEFNLYLITEYCPDGELWSLTTGIGILHLPLCRCYAAQIVNAVEYAHSRGIVHRDLKAENILLAPDGKLRLIDFGTAWDTQRPELQLVGNRSGSPMTSKTYQHFVGTANFMPPEAVQNKPSGRLSDLWALGATLYQIASGKPPFEAPSEFLTHLASKNLLLNFPPHFPPLLEDLVRMLMRVDPAERLGGSDPDNLCGVKSHPFFEGINWANPTHNLVESPWPTLGVLCFSHMSREWNRFEEKWRDAGWLEEQATVGSEELLEKYLKPARPSALEMQSRELLQLFRGEVVLPELRSRLLWWKELEKSRTQVYWDGLVAEFMGQGQAAISEASSDETAE